MSFFDRQIDLATGEASFYVRASTLVSLEGSGGSVSFNNRGLTFASGEVAAGSEKFVEGLCVAYGTPGSRATAWFRF